MAKFKWGDRVRVISGSSVKDRQFLGQVGTIKSHPLPWQFGLIKQCPHKIQGMVYYSVELDNKLPIPNSNNKVGTIFAFCEHELELADKPKLIDIKPKVDKPVAQGNIWANFPGGKKPF